MTPTQLQRAASYAAWPGAKLVERIIQLEEEIEEADPFSATDANCPACGATLTPPRPIDLHDDMPFLPDDSDDGA